MPNKFQIAAGLDAGSAYTRCVIGLVEDGRQRYLGHGEVRSAGWTRGRIVDQQALAMCVQSAVQQGEAAAGVSVEGLVIGIGGLGVQGFNNRGVYEFGHPRQITQEDLKYAVERAIRIRLEDGRSMLQIFPQDFTLDGRAGYRNPRGTSCRRLEANVYIATASTFEQDCLINAVHEAHYAVEETVFEPMAAAYAGIVKDDRNRGVALVDIGLESTGLVVYDGEAMLLTKSLPISADHFTRDVAFGLKVAYEDAESLKVDYGCAVLGLTADNSFIELPTAEGRPPREASRRHLNAILEARAEEMFGFVRQELTAVGMEQNLLEGVVLTGGGAMLSGMCDMAEQVLNCQARNGLPLDIENLPAELENTAWTTAAGLMMYSARLKLRRESRRRSPGFIRAVFKS